MAPRVIRVDAERPEKAAIDEAADILRRGGLVAFPTETVYGLGGRALDRASIERIYAAKGRPERHPIIAHVLDEAGARAVASEWSALASQLARAFWPGPLTIIAPKRDDVPSELTGGGDSVGIRAPAHPVARALIAALGEPIAAPSANRFQKISPTCAAHVVKSLGDAVDLVLDGGSCARGIESTVVSISRENEIRLLRPGSISITQLRAHAHVIYENENVAADVMRASPGLDAKHYAPRARLVIAAREKFSSLLADQNRNVGLISRGNTAEFSAFERRVLPSDADGFAAALFATLHDFDDAGCDVIVVEEPPLGDAWIAVRDRLTRAAEK
ncbi:MAG: L-threonylcarbamoyladenylate synthase [Polyangiaceae bacterium]